MPISFSDLNILVCEDNEALNNIVCEVLRNLKFRQVLTCRDGQRGFEIFQKERPDIIITDWEMEPGDGIELIHNIRQAPTSVNRDVAIIILTGYGFHERIAKARDMGVTEYLIKPFTAEGLVQRITHVINAPRDVVEAPNFYGPDRRRKERDFEGPDKRDADEFVVDS